MITIGQLAAYAGVTVKAVRHYHQRGLLDEPARDGSGYRRYTADDAVRLLKIRTLAEAGVPLARIKELLAAEPDQFATAVTEIDRALRQRAEVIRHTRQRLAQLRAGDGLFVSAEVADYLHRLRELGVSHRGLQAERDGWILMQSVSPQQAAVWLADKRDAVSDPDFCAIYLDYDAAFDWSADDPRLDALAERVERWLASRHSEAERTQWPAPVAQIAELVAASSTVICGVGPTDRDRQAARREQIAGQPRIAGLDPVAYGDRR